MHAGIDDLTVVHGKMKPAPNQAQAPHEGLPRGLLKNYGAHQRGA